MKIERSKNEILVRLSSKTNTSDLQDLLDYLEYKELVSKSTANQEDINQLVTEINSAIHKKALKTKA